MSSWPGSVKYSEVRCLSYLSLFFGRKFEVEPSFFFFLSEVYLFSFFLYRTKWSRSYFTFWCSVPIEICVWGPFRSFVVIHSFCFLSFIFFCIESVSFYGGFSRNSVSWIILILKLCSSWVSVVDFFPFFFLTSRFLYATFDFGWDLLFLYFVLDVSWFLSTKF